MQLGLLTFINSHLLPKHSLEYFLEPHFWAQLPVFLRRPVWLAVLELFEASCLAAEIIVWFFGSTVRIYWRWNFWDFRSWQRFAFIVGFRVLCCSLKCSNYVFGLKLTVFGVFFCFKHCCSAALSSFSPSRNPTFCSKLAFFYCLLKFIMRIGR